MKLRRRNKASGAALLVALAMVLSLISVNPARAGEPDVAPCPGYREMYHQFVDGLVGNRLGFAVQHRGAFSTDVPGNSLGAFRRSFALCQPAIETDVRTTRDGQLVLFHDTNTGLALEQGFDPDTGQGPNPALSSVDYADLVTKKLLTKDRRPTEFEVPTLTQLLSTADVTQAATLMHLDVKEPDQAIRIARVIDDYETSHPDSHMTQRVALKIPINEFPRPSDWKSSLDRAGVKRTIMVIPMMNPGTAASLDTSGHAGLSIESLSAWAAAPAAEAPTVEVLVKDSSDVHEKHQESSPFGTYEAPHSRDPDNAENGTMAAMAFVVSSYGKPLGNFVPIPDRMLWENKTYSGYTVPNVGGDRRPFNVTDAFYNADGRCCYNLADKLSPSPYGQEKSDLRENIAWQSAMGVRIFTVDDSDSVHTYLSDQGVLDKKSVTNPQRQIEASRSWLYWQLLGMPIPNEQMVSLKAWRGGSSAIWQGQVCIFNWRDHPAWATSCLYNKQSGYSWEMEISVVDDHYMRIKNQLDQQCLMSKPDDLSYVYWTDDCNSPRSRWTRLPGDQYMDADGHFLTFSWQDRYSWGVPWAYLWLTDKQDNPWSHWSFDV